jgi:hypothetical protein
MEEQQNIHSAPYLRFIFSGGFMTRNVTPEQRKKWNRTYYEKNKEKRLAQYNAWKNELREWFHELKKDLKCSRCSFDHVAALHFHHIDETQKAYTVSEMIGMGLSKETILREIEKCEVLCANCHAIEHYNKRMLS